MFYVSSVKCERNICDVSDNLWDHVLVRDLRMERKLIVTLWVCIGERGRTVSDRSILRCEGLESDNTGSYKVLWLYYFHTGSSVITSEYIRCRSRCSSKIRSTREASKTWEISSVLTKVTAERRRPQEWEATWMFCIKLNINHRLRLNKGLW